MAEDWQSGKSLEETNLYMLEHGLGSDITLVLGPSAEKISAHKFMLASRSMVFYAMFFGQLPETGEEVRIPEIEPLVMKNFLRYLYSNRVSIGPDNVMALMYCSKKYSVQTLTDKCCKYLQTEINSSNVCTIMEQAHVFDEKELWEHCLLTVFSNSEEVLTNEDKDYLTLCYSCLKAIVSDDRLMLREECIYTACKTWAEEQCVKKNLENTDDNLRHVLGDILTLIRFPLMTERTFTEIVSLGHLLTTEEKLSVYQCFHQSPTDGDRHSDIRSKFSSRSRMNTQVLRLARFQETVGGNLDFWLNDNLFDAISFKCSRSVCLTGIAVFSPFPDGIIRGSLWVFDETNTCVTKSDRLEISSSSSKTVDINLQKAVKLYENRWYTVRQQMCGSKSYFGMDGQKEVIGKGTVFAFRKSPMDNNNTNVNSGQIFGLLYV